jgi:HD-GYP domain-containing protein (c-di-GMP phosphodiesterase class II)
VLLDQLADSKDEGSRRLQATSHIAFSFIKEIDTPDPTQLEILDGAEMTADIGDIWQDIIVGEGLNANAISDIVTGIAKAVTDSNNALLPLAFLKKHDEYTFVHANNVAILTVALSESLGFDSTGVRELCLASLLHDVGKRLVPEELLNKNGRLTDEEFKIIQMHPVEGARLLLKSPGVPELASIVAYEHHMNADGSGYPKVPKGWKLNLASRIVQIVDVFDALRSHRPYRRGMPVPKIIEIMQGDVGTCFDADLLDVFLQQIVMRQIPDPTDVVEV